MLLAIIDIYLRTIEKYNKTKIVNIKYCSSRTRVHFQE